MTVNLKNIRIFDGHTAAWPHDDRYISYSLVPSKDCFKIGMNSWFISLVMILTQADTLTKSPMVRCNTEVFVHKAPPHAAVTILPCRCPPGQAHCNWSRESRCSSSQTSEVKSKPLFSLSWYMCTFCLTFTGYTVMEQWRKPDHWNLHRLDSSIWIQWITILKKGVQELSPVKRSRWYL